MAVWFSQTNFQPTGGGGGGTGAPVQGPTGPGGPRGYTGAPGATGLPGWTGLRGLTGIPGGNGLTGVDGATGTQGWTGLNGDQGATGAAGGGTGLQGFTGVPGIDGATGLQGATGSSGGGTGMQGATGAPGGGTGLQGATGIGVTGLQGVTGPAGSGYGATGLQGYTGSQGVTGVGPQGSTGTVGPQGVTGPSGGGGSGDGATGLRGLDGDGIIWVQAALLGTASNTTGYFSVQPGYANPFGIPIDTSASTYGNGSVNGLKIPFDYELKEVHVSVAHCAVGAPTASSTVFLNLGCHVFQGASDSTLGNLKVPLDGTKCGVYNNLGADNFQKSSLTVITGISGSAGDLFGFRFSNISSSTTDINAVSRCTVLIKLQRTNWTPGGDKGETGVQGIKGDTGVMGVTGPFGGPQGSTGTSGITGIKGDTGVQGVTGIPGGGTGLQGATGVRGVDGDGIVWVQAAMLGTASSTTGLFSVQPGNSNPFGVPIDTGSGSYNGGSVNGLKIPFDYDLLELYVSVGHCAVSATSVASPVFLNMDFHTYQGTSEYLLGTVKVQLDGSRCGVLNNLGGDNFQKAVVQGISGISGTAGDLFGFRFRNVSGPSDINALSRCTVLAKIQRQNWTPGGFKGETGVRGVTGIVGASGATGVQSVPGDTVLWAQASLLGTASSSLGLYSVQPGSGNPYGVPVGNPYGNYANGSVNALRMPWPYVVQEVHLVVAHVAVSSAVANPVVNFTLDFDRHKGTSSSPVGSVQVPLDGANCGVYNNLGGDNFQAVTVTGLGLTGPSTELVGFNFRNIAGPSDINSVSRSTVLVKFRKQGT